MRRVQGFLADYSVVADLFLPSGSVLGRIGTDSMAPVLQAGDQIHIDPLLSPPEPGDLVVTRSPQGWLCHRLERSYVDGGVQWYVTQGNFAEGEDPPVRSEQIIGRVTQVERPRGVSRWWWQLRSFAGRQLRHPQLSLVTRLFEGPAKK